MKENRYELAQVVGSVDTVGLEEHPGGQRQLVALLPEHAQSVGPCDGMFARVLPSRATCQAERVGIDDLCYKSAIICCMEVRGVEF